MGGLSWVEVGWGGVGVGIGIGGRPAGWGATGFC